MPLSPDPRQNRKRKNIVLLLVLLGLMGLVYAITLMKIGGGMAQ